MGNLKFLRSGISPKFPIPLLTTYMHHEIEFNLSGSSLATVLTDLHNQVAFRKNLVKPEAQLLMTRRGGVGWGGGGGLPKEAPREMQI